MSKYFFGLIIIIVIVVFGFQCKKSNKKNNSIGTNTTLQKQNLKKKIFVSYDKLFKIIQDSNTMDIDTFFAITVCIKINAKKYNNKIESLTIKQKTDFFENKTKSFFNSIKFSQDEYNNFIIEHSDEIPSYLELHPELKPYINTFNINQ